MDLKKYFWASLILAIICLFGAFLAVMSSGEANYYNKLTVTGVGDISGTHEGRLGDEVGADNASAIIYNYEKIQNEEGSGEQTSEFMVSGTAGTFWDRYVVKTDSAIAGSNQVTYRVSKIADSFYAKSGMNISFNAADGAEEFESTISIEADNASIGIQVIRWVGAGEPTLEINESTGQIEGYTSGGSMGKPVTLAELNLIGKFVINDIVRIKEPLTTPQDWLGFCNALDDQLPDGYIVTPAGMVWRNGTTWDYGNSTVYRVDK
jgi:hypothetical protein